MLAIFVALVETVLGTVTTRLEGAAQTALVAFVIGFPLLVLGLFAYLIVARPENFYAPSDFQNAGVYERLVTRRDQQLRQKLRNQEQEIRVAHEDIRRLSERAHEVLKDTARNLPELLNALQEVPLARAKDAQDAVSEYADLVKATNASLQQLFFRLPELPEKFTFEIALDSGSWDLCLLRRACAQAADRIEAGDINGSMTVDGQDDFFYVFDYSVDQRMRRVTLRLTHSYSGLG